MQFGGIVTIAVAPIPKIGEFKRRHDLKVCGAVADWCLNTDLNSISSSSPCKTDRDLLNIWMEPFTAARLQAACANSLDPQQGTTKGPARPSKCITEALKACKISMVLLIDSFRTSSSELHLQTPKAIKWNTRESLWMSSLAKKSKRVVDCGPSVLESELRSLLSFRFSRRDNEASSMTCSLERGIEINFRGIVHMNWLSTAVNSV